MKYRSVLFVPGHEEKKIKKAYTLNADLIVLDLESTVPNNLKENAKKIIINCNVNKKKTYIRVNSSHDLTFVTKEKFLGIFLPFAESKDQLVKINDELKKAIHRMSEKGLTLPLECTLKDEIPIKLEAHEDFEQADLEE